MASAVHASRASLHPDSATTSSNRAALLHSPTPNQYSKRAKSRRSVCLASGNGVDAAVDDGLVELGKSGLRVSKIGVGTLQWGDPDTGFGRDYSETDISEAFQIHVDGGINFFDTAEVYGYQGIKTQTSSEFILGHNAAATDRPLVLASKFFTVPWTNVLVGGGMRMGRESLVKALRASLQRLGREQLDLYQIHFPLPTFPNSVAADALEEALQLGLTKAVGVSNYNLEQLQDIYTRLDKKGIQLASNQVRYSLLSRDIAKNGLLQACKDMGVSVIAYSPLASGKLSAKYLDSNNKDNVRQVVKLLEFIGAVNGGRSVSQVALNYLVARGAIPIAGCKNAAQARDHVAALSWSLDDNEVAILDEKLDALKM